MATLSAPLRRPPAVLFVLALCLLVPVTLPIAGLRPLVAERFEVSDFATSIFLSINMLGALVAAPLAGALADRGVPARRAIVAALLADAAAFALLCAPLPFAAFLVVRFAEGAAHITALALLFAHGAHEPAGEGHARRMSALGAGLTLGVAVGAPLGGLLATSDPLRPLWSGALVSLGTALLALVLLPPAAPALRRAPLGASLRAVARQAELRLPLAYAFVDRFTVGFFTACFPLYLSRVHAAEPRTIGLLLALFLLPFALLAYPLGRVFAGGRLLIGVCGGSLVYGVLAASLGWWSVEFLPGLMLALGLASAVMFVPSILLTSAIAPDAARGTALGAFHSAGSLGFLAGPLVGAAVAEALAPAIGWHGGYRASFAVAGSAEIACVALTLPALLALRRAGRIA